MFSSHLYVCGILGFTLLISSCAGHPIAEQASANSTDVSSPTTEASSSTTEAARTEDTLSTIAPVVNTDNDGPTTPQSQPTTLSQELSSTASEPIHTTDDPFTNEVESDKVPEKTLSSEGRTMFASEGAADVVSKYTTLPPTAQTPRPLDIYQQIANNIAERITSPIYRFLGYDAAAAKPARAHLELVDETPEEVTKANVKPISNEIESRREVESEREVEELSAERLQKTDDTKPEKITLYSGYLPVERMDRIIQNSTNATSTNVTNAFANSINVDNNVTSTLPDDDDFDFDEFGDTDYKGTAGNFAYILELIGGLFTLAWGAIVACFSSRPS